MSGAGAGEGLQESYLRLQEEHAKALNLSRERTAKWEGFKRDYEALQARLHTLPDQLTHDVMVPFGKCAFMPGKLYHTNEVMVLLGDNWFAKRSAKQALELAGRRREYVMKKLEEERKQLQDWEARLAFTEDIRSSQQEHGGVLKEIQEEVRGEESNIEYSNGKRVWKARKPAKGVPPPKPAFPTTTPQAPPPLQKTPATTPAASEPQQEGGGATSGHTLTDEQLWARLDELEREEEGEEREGGEVRARSAGRSGSGTLQIRVRHSASAKEPDTVPPQERGRAEAAPTEPPLFLTPGDISRDAPPPRSSPSSEEEGGGAGSEEEGGGAGSEEEEEKGVSWDPQLVRCKEEEEEEGVSGRPEGERGRVARPREERRPLAFSGQVVERVTPTATMSATDSKPKKISKFKASRKT